MPYINFPFPAWEHQFRGWERQFPLWETRVSKAGNARVQGRKRGRYRSIPLPNVKENKGEARLR